ncbi:MAG: rubrerythrin family protein [Desulfovibrionaceae bacterium]
MSKTLENLKAAFAGESQANRKYLAFAEKADRDGLGQVAKLFRAAAAAETIHAHAHLRAMKGIGTTAENLKAAMDGEVYEYEDMYPDMIKEAEAAGEAAALRSFSYANAVEKVHADLYAKALADPAGMAATDYYICPVCGYTHEGPYEGACPVCVTDGSKFVKVD